MRRMLMMIVVAVPLLMCFQCGCDEPDVISEERMENATDEDLYWCYSAEPWANAECRWVHLPGRFSTHYDRHLHKYLLVVDVGMQLRACWPVDSLPMADTARWVADTAVLDYTNCNGVHPVKYTRTFVLQAADLE